MFVRICYHMILKQYFMAAEVELFFLTEKNNLVRDGLMILRASNQVLCNVWSFYFHDMMLSTK